MNTVNMPGFSAEASLYRSSAPYQIGAMLAGLKQQGEVIPSMKDVWFEAYCDMRGTYCATHVLVPGVGTLLTICWTGGRCYQEWY